MFEPRACLFVEMFSDILQVFVDFLFFQGHQRLNSAFCFLHEVLPDPHVVPVGCIASLVMLHSAETADRLAAVITPPEFVHGLLLRAAIAGQDGLEFVSKFLRWLIT